jgi:hypothetical protein
MSIHEGRARRAPSANPIALRPADAAAALGVSEGFLAKLVSQGKMRRPVAVTRGVSLYDYERLHADWQALRDAIEQEAEELNPWDRFLE